MGWLYYAASFDQLVMDRLQRDPHITVLDYHLQDGAVLWRLERQLVDRDLPYAGIKAGTILTYITCDILEPYNGKWGYKSMDESAHPFYYGCPLRFLDMAPAICPEWRHKVRQYHAAAASRAKAREVRRAR